MNLIQIKRQWGLHHVRAEMRSNLNLYKWRRWDNAISGNSFLEVKKQYKKLGISIKIALLTDSPEALMTAIPRLIVGLRNTTDWVGFFDDKFNIDLGICDSCGSFNHRDNTHSLDDDGIVCDSCTSDFYWNDAEGYYQNDPIDDEEEEGQDGCILGRHASKRLLGYIPTEYAKRKPEVYLGLELEMEVDTDQYRVDKAEELLDHIQWVYGVDGNKYRYCSTEDDGSLNYGFEMVTAYTGLDIHKKQLSFFKNRFKDVKSHDTKSCGLHVHICKSDMTLLHASKLVFFINDEKNTKLIHAIARRSEWWACKLHPSKTKDLTYIKDTLKSYSMKKNQLRFLNQDRYEALNFQNEKTVEFRIFRGSLKYETIMSCLEFTYASWFFARNSSVEQLDIPHFIDFICKPENLQDTQFLRPYLFKKGFSSYSQLQPKKQKEIA